MTSMIIYVDLSGSVFISRFTAAPHVHVRASDVVVVNPDSGRVQVLNDQNQAEPHSTLKRLPVDESLDPPERTVGTYRKKSVI